MLIFLTILNLTLNIKCVLFRKQDTTSFLFLSFSCKYRVCCLFCVILLLPSFSMQLFVFLMNFSYQINEAFRSSPDPFNYFRKIILALLDQKIEINS